MESAQGFWREHVEVHPKIKAATTARMASTPTIMPGGAPSDSVGGLRGLAGRRRVPRWYFRSWGLLVFGAHAGFLSEVRHLRRVVTP